MRRKRAVIAAVILLVVIVVIIAGVVLLSQRPEEEAVLMDDLIHIQLSSDPFPLTVGQNTLIVKLVRNGEPVDGADVEIEANRTMAGQLPLSATGRGSEAGVYRIPVIWPAVDRWVIHVNAALGRERVEDSFTVFVFAVPEDNMSDREAYASNHAMAAAQAAHPEEFWIIIPQGTAAQIREGHGDDVMPTEIRLTVDRRNTLVLKNNDLADHTIGPFFVRAGETLRQRFSTPQIYEGVCSVRHDSTVKIIVE